MRVPAASRLPSPQLALACFYVTGGALTLVTLLGDWPLASPPLIAAVGVASLLLGLAVACLPRMPGWACHVLLASGTGAICLLVVLSGGGAASATNAFFTVWVGIYAGLFFRPLAAALHVSSTGVLLTVALAVEGSEQALAVHVVVVVSCNAISCLLIGALVERLRRAALTDPLTGLPTRRGLDDLTGSALPARGTSVVVLVLTVRRLRDVNEALGHDSGDTLLVAAAATARAFADDGGGWAARLSGRHFAVVLPVPGRAPLTPADQAVLAQRLVAAVRGPWPVEGLHVHLDATVGAAWAEGPLHDLEPALLAAEAAARAARDCGLVVQTDSASGRVGDRDGLALAQQLWKAIENDELRLHVQPVMDSSRHEVVAVEALVRWQHPTRGLLGPAAFLPQAEQSSSIFPLTWWVLEASLDQCRAWRDAGSLVPVAVNLSARLLGDPDLAEQVRTRLVERRLAPDLLTLEVTESALVAHPQLAVRNIAQLRALGVHVSIDDFGTGFTSLSMLAHLQVDELKVDRTFVGAALTSSGADAIVRSVVDLGHRLGLRVVGEGVEDEATSRLLQSLGYDRQQGYLYSRPLPPGELADVLGLPSLDHAVVPHARTATG